MPDAWKKMTGNAGNRPLAEASAVAVLPAGAPDCPDFLDDQAKAEWARIVPHLDQAGLLTQVDHAQLAMYCQAYSRWRLAEKKIQEAAEKDEKGCGLVGRSKNGFEQMSYWLVISNKAQEQLAKYLGEFGLSPVARARAKVGAAQGDLFGNDPLSGFLKAAPGAA